jgi:hypothetical protein
MPEPVSTIAIIEVGAAVVGAIAGSAAAVPGGDTGVNVGACSIHYPKEFPTEMFAHAGQSVQRDVIKFHSEGAFYDNDLAVAMTGYVSHDHEALLGRPGSDHPNVPVNRFILLTLDKSSNSEDMSRGLLTVNIGLWGGASDIAEGTADDPWVALHVHGRFDPLGPGDIEYSFKLMISSFGQIAMSDENWTGTYVDNGSIRFHGDYVTVWLA